jgi:uncharacterized membrane protein SirB2
MIACALPRCWRNTFGKWTKHLSSLVCVLALFNGIHLILIQNITAFALSKKWIHNKLQRELRFFLKRSSFLPSLTNAEAIQWFWYFGKLDQMGDSVLGRDR